MYGKKEQVLTLLRAGADLKIKSKNGYRAYDFAMLEEHSTIAELVKC